MEPWAKFVLGLLAVSASAQSLDRPTRLSFFISNVSLAWSEGSGGAWDAGYGLALERRFSRAWSGELAVSYELHETQPYFLNPTRIDVQTCPVDAVVRYTFPNVHARWRPYVGAGARYVGAPEEPFNVEYEDMLAPQAAAVIEFQRGRGVVAALRPEAPAEGRRAGLRRRVQGVGRHPLAVLT